MNLICTAVDDHATTQLQFHFVREWRKFRHIVEVVPIERLITYLRFDPASALAQVDAIICNADSNLISENEDFLEYRAPLGTALKLADAVRGLPEGCAMRDGRKWKSIPFIIFRNAFDEPPYYLEYPEVEILAPIYNRHPLPALNEIGRIVDADHDLILSDYIALGLLVRLENGHVQIGPALRSRNSDVESAYYYAPADTRSNRGWVTVKRDGEGLRHDIRIFERLLETNASETQMHRFFEEHPAFLTDALLGIPISHRPIFTRPDGCTPDYSILPILGPLMTTVVELLEMKGPGESLLTGRLHRGFAAKVHRALDQVRDYDRYLRDPANAESVMKSFGYIPSGSNQAVLIGRYPKNTADKEVLLQRTTEIGVKIITYDHILQVQSAFC